MEKKEILKIFQKEPEKYWRVELFSREGFRRKVCPSCGKGFWSIKERNHCPDPECGESYGFIENPIAKKMSYVEVWKKMEDFFMRNGHTSIPRYPVLARWREDIYYNIASIVDFQRFDNGVMVFEYPANPLIVPQTCLRFNDILNVGVTGRHFTAFVMPGQHSFNWPSEGYWKDRTIELNFRFLTEELKIPKEEIVYVEDLWTMPDFSALGPYLESFSLGLELSNSGFMYFTWQNGLKELPMKVVDVGWGLERLAWFSQSTLTAYEAVFGDVVEKFVRKSGLTIDRDIWKKYTVISGRLNVEDLSDFKKARNEVVKNLKIDEKDFVEKIEKIQAMYAVLDHARALAFAISDGGLPSNTGAGYFLRVILRRSLNFIEKYFPNIELAEVSLWHTEFLKPIFPELDEHKNEIFVVIEAEKKKFFDSKKKNSKIVEIYKGKNLSIEDLVKIYETHGISPEELGRESTKEFYEILNKRHATKKEKIGEAKSYEFTTQPLYYQNIFEFDAKVLKVEGNKVILDRTAFFPRQGGQDCDKGYIGECKVVDVMKIGKTVIHVLEDCKLKEGDTVKCRVDLNRRMVLSRHHVATHIINAAARKKIGGWVWQEGSEVREDKARLDITHFESLSEEEIEKIEEYANDIVERNLPIKIEVLKRSEAEKKFGFRIYQGGAIPESFVRIVSIGDEDVEACSGTHHMLASTKDVGYITILKTKRISDGVVRLEFCSGEAAYEYLKNKEKIIRECCDLLNVSEEELPSAVERLFKEWKKLRKEVKK